MSEDLDQLMFRGLSRGCKKYVIFKEFESGKRPSELYSIGLKKKTLYDYYQLYKKRKHTIKKIKIVKKERDKLKIEKSALEFTINRLSRTYENYSVKGPDKKAIGARSLDALWDLIIQREAELNSIVEAIKKKDREIEMLYEKL